MFLINLKLRSAIRRKVRKAHRNLGYKPNVRQPRTFNEKIIRRCFQPVDPIMTRTSDKLAVKFWLEEVRAADSALAGLEPVPLLWHGKGDIPWDSLTYPCVLKANHSWNMHRILHGAPDSAEAAEIAEETKGWLAYRFGRSTHEPQYASIEPALLIEALITDNTDYKCFIFGGVVEFVLVAKDRAAGTRTANLDRNGKPLPFLRGVTESADATELELPAQFSRMVELAEALTPHLGEVGKEFVRLDFYISDGVVYLGEVTWTPGGGRLPFEPQHWDEHFGQKFQQQLKPLVPPG
jgi:hypothetical protein